MTKQYADSLLMILRAIPTKPGWFPKLEQIAVKLNIPKYKVSKLLKELVEIGYLSRVGNWYNFLDKDKIKQFSIGDYVTIDKQIDEYAGKTINLDFSGCPGGKTTKVPNLLERLEQYKEEKALGDLVTIPIPVKDSKLYITFIRWSMLILGIAAEIVSIYYTFIWASETLMLPLAIILSFIIALFSTIAFETMIAIYLNNSNFIRWVGSISFFLLWILLVSLSIGATVAGQFNLFVKKQNIEIVSQANENSSNAEYNDLLSTENELLDKRKLLVEQLKPMLDIANDMKNMEQFFVEDKRSKESTVYFDNQYRIGLLNKSIEKIDQDLATIRDRKKLAINTGGLLFKKVSDIPDFYSWFGKVIKSNKDLAQFWFTLIPAALLDLISPVGFAVFLFLKKKEE